VESPTVLETSTKLEIPRIARGLGRRSTMYLFITKTGVTYRKVASSLEVEPSSIRSSTELYLIPGKSGSTMRAAGGIPCRVQFASWEPIIRSQFKACPIGNELPTSQGCSSLFSSRCEFAHHCSNVVFSLHSPAASEHRYIDI